MQNETTKPAQSKKKRTCKRRMNHRNPSSARREGNRFETLRTDEVAALRKEIEINAVAFIRITVDSGAAKSVVASAKERRRENEVEALGETGGREPRCHP